MLLYTILIGYTATESSLTRVMLKLHCRLADEFDAFLRMTTHFLLPEMSTKGKVQR